MVLSALIQRQIMDWHRPGDKPLSEPMMIRLPTHICATRPQWHKNHYNDVITSAITSQIIRLTIVYSTVYTGADEKKASRHWTLCGEFPTQRAATRKMFIFDDVIMGPEKYFWSDSYFTPEPNQLTLWEQRRDIHHEDPVLCVTMSSAWPHGLNHSYEALLCKMCHEEGFNRCEPTQASIPYQEMV